MNVGELLTNSLSPDHNTRHAAEQALETAARDNYSVYMISLATELASDSAQQFIRSASGLALKNALAARDLKRASEYAERWTALPANVRDEVKSNVLMTLRTSDARAGTAASQVVAAMSAIELPRGMWPDLISQLLAAVGDTSNPRLRQAALQSIGFTCEVVDPAVLSTQSNEILTAVIQGARKEETSHEVQLAALHALLNSLEFVRSNFEREGERNYIMQVVCEATQSPHSPVKAAAFENLVRIMQLYYEKMRFYMEQALFGLTVLGMRDPDPSVALQAVEFWSTVCDEEIELQMEAAEALEYNEEPLHVSYHFARIALPEIAPVLMELLTQQDEGTDEDEWDVAKAAGTCLGLLAQVVGDAIVAITVPFIEANIKSPDWRRREAALMCFGSIMDGPESKLLETLVVQALATVIETLQDTSTAVKDTAAWTLGRICEFVYDAIAPEVQLGPLIQALLGGLQDQPRIVTHCCWALINLSEHKGILASLDDIDPPTTCLSPYFETIATHLVQAADRPNNESNSRTSAYEALASLIANCAQDCLQHASNVLVHVIERQEQLNAMVAQLVGLDDRNNWAELQSNLCSVMIAAVRRIQGGIAPVADRLMAGLLTLIQNSAKQPTVLEDAFIAVGTVIVALDAAFEKYLEAFLPFLVEGLRHHEEYQLCTISVGNVGDICRSLGGASVKYIETLIVILFEDLQSPVLNRTVKPHILSCFGDIAMAIGAAFEPYLGTTMAVLQQASMVQNTADADYEMSEYVNDLRSGIAEAYVGIVSGVRAGNKADLFYPYVESTLAFIGLVASDSADRSEVLLRSTIGLLGDLACAFPAGPVMQQLQQQWVLDYIKVGRSRGNGAETRKTANWARELVKKSTMGSSAVGTPTL
ncbi:karyopherin Kap95 [Malassezia vespertilionis]|uniref:Importin-95 n=1 Tax=Malassezia vespertilionis TaxID=2020962 RepID=A0A2N1JF35_9BASI|nr:karyopherin Kap95 [Malassezia vespertilionis]PKI85159.1 Kap95p [Malassezia vespertilionis]WFD06103.1 karyopherin Kap95 [Malassezia vespertilionis]